MFVLQSIYFTKRAAFNRSKFRSSFYLDSDEVTYVKKRGIHEIQIHAREFVTRRLAPKIIKNDGKQTPYRGHPVFKAQHATATCCRGCLRKWYNVSIGRLLSKDEIEQISYILIDWIEKKIKK